MKKKLLSWFLALGLAATSLSPVGAWADTADGQVSEEVLQKLSEERADKTGRLRMEYIDTDFSDVDEDEIVTAPSKPLDPSSKEGRAKASERYDNDWDIYSSNFVYNNLTDAEKALWDTLDSMCLEYLTTTEDAEGKSEGWSTYYRLGVIRSQSLSFDEVQRVYDLFLFENPQYYFLSYRFHSDGRGRGGAFSRGL